MRYKVPFVDLTRQFGRYSREIMEAITKVAESGRYVGGEEVSKFERQFADYLGTRFGLGVASGSDALILALQALGIGQGDEVATVSFTFVSTVDAIRHVGAIPGFTDIRPDDLTMDPESLESVMNDKVKAIMPVHLYGKSAEMSAIIDVAKRWDVPVIEDAAQAHGALYQGKRLGAIGDISCFSFYPSKNLGALGDGGFVATNNEEIAEKIKLLREYGQKEKYSHVLLGKNSRLDAIQASVLGVKLKHLDSWNQARISVAGKYHDLLSKFDSIQLPSEDRKGNHVYHIYGILVMNRDNIRTFLENDGIETGIHYPIPVHQQLSYQNCEWRSSSSLYNTVRAAKDELSLPMFPELTDTMIESVCVSLKRALVP